MTIIQSTRLFYDRSSSAMQTLTARAETLNTQVSTGKRLLAPSDGSVAYQRLQGLARTGADDSAYSANITLAQSVLQQADTTLGSITDQLQKASELAVQAGNGTLSTEARAAIATQLEGILDTIVGLANGKDVRGQPLFGGAGDGVAVTKSADGALVFATGDAASIPIGDGQNVQPSGNAGAFLSTTSGGDIGSALTALVTALRSGTEIPATATADLAAISTRVINAQASVGARAARVDLQAAQLKSAATDREITRSGIEDVDVTEAITDLQKTMTILQATQASFSKLSALSLFDYLR